MTSAEIRTFAEEVYKQCVDRKMTYEEFRFFVLDMTLYKEATNSALHKQYEKLPLPTLESIR